MTSQFESYQQASDSVQSQSKAAVCDNLKRLQRPDYRLYLERGRLQRSLHAHACFRAIKARLRKLAGF